MVLGTINDKMGPVLKQIYDQMAEPKWVISMGACATCGGFYRAYHVMQGIDEIIPVDVYIPGCPPTPEAVLDAVIKLQQQVENDTRLSYERHPRQTQLKTPELDATVHGLQGPPRSLVRFLEENQDVQGPIAAGVQTAVSQTTSSACASSAAIFRSPSSARTSKMILRTLKNGPGLRLQDAAGCDCRRLSRRARIALRRRLPLAVAFE